MIYLDHNATTPVRPEVRAAMEPFLYSSFGNASSAHRLGGAARLAVETARQELAARVNAKPSAIVFTSGGTESNNWAVLGAIDEPRGVHVIASPLEHSSVIEPVRELARRGAEITWLPVSATGHVDPDDVAAALRPNTVLVCVGWANNELGTLAPIAALAAVCRRAGARLHVDAVQALGKIPVDVAGVDSCALSAHKIGGPQGVGALVVGAGHTLRPLLLGGGQERGRRAGTENVAGIVGFGAAAALISDWRAAGESLRERLWNGIASIAGSCRHSPSDECLPNTLNVRFVHVRGEALVAALDLEGVAVSVGSACAAGSGEASHVLRAIGLSEDDARDGVRFSLGEKTTAEDIDAVVTVVGEVVARMRGVRPQRVVNA